MDLDLDWIGEILVEIREVEVKDINLIKYLLNS